MVRPPVSVARKLRELAAASNDGTGLSLNQYCVTILSRAAEKEITIREKKITELSRPIVGDPHDSTDAKKA